MKFVEEKDFEDIVNYARWSIAYGDVRVNATNLSALTFIDGIEIYDVVESVLEDRYEYLDASLLKELFSDKSSVIPNALGYKSWDSLGMDVYNQRHGGKR
jgi:hypothetical protein